MNLTKYDVGFWVCLIISAVIASNGDSVTDLVFSAIWVVLAVVSWIFGNRKERKP